MLVFGIVTASKPHMVKVRIPEMDEFESDWYFVPQMMTVKDKSSNSLAINTEVAICVKEDLSDGCVIGCLYNSVDLPQNDKEYIKSIYFEDGTFVQYDKQNKTISINSSDVININAKTINIKGETNIDGNLTSTKEITDKTSSMTSIRNTFNSHTHGNGNNGNDTTTPNSSM